MTPREKLQLSYELAFFPPRLNQVCRGLSREATPMMQELCEALDDACRLHLALPLRGYASQRALERLALYQARSRAYGIPGFIQAVRRRLERPALTDGEVPARLVRDIGLPAFTRPPHQRFSSR